jgi:processive 1,2-diacylglycerol beta-glucosyltransferase
MLKVLVLQRESNVALGVPSLSVAARITEVLEYLESLDKLHFAVISENESVASNGVNWADVLILSKHSSRTALELVIKARKRGVRVIYDIDDWIFSFPKYSGGKLQKKIELIYEIIRQSHVVTVANNTLLNKVGAIFPEINLVLVPNGMWVEKYIDLEQNISLEAIPPRIIFTNADLLKVQSAKEILLTALQIFFLRNKDYILDFYGDPFPEMFSLPFLYFTNRMPYSDYMRALVSGRYQFGITPLGGDEDPDSADFNRCKNPFKYLNYGAAKVPAIYSKSSIYTKVINNEENGILINNVLDEWVGALELLATDKSLRNKIRSSAFNDVYNNHHISSSAGVLMAVMLRQ